MWGIRHIANVLLFMLIATVTVAQTDDELKENADKLFEDEKYVEATSLYLRLLSPNPKNADYNFRYGTCLLFNSYQKQEAIRYLNFAVAQPDIDPRAFYFHGRAMHLNYQFDKAKTSYQSYLQKRDKRDNRYEVERQIEMCENGKRLLSTFTDIIVSEKKEIDNQKFFRLYSDSRTIGGNILVTADFQSKIDRKKEHVPIVHFPPNAQAIYYSSYGDDESTGKDIYIRRRLPGGGWGDPEKLPGKVNTNEDEDFPYMHPSGEFLYFSSKGHNSMGGYDIFYSRFDPNTNSFGTPENVDFAISSPDDDLFYVVDSLYRNAYFASARQSQNGKLHVYRVRVARVPVQEVIVMGDYLSEINPENKDMKVRVLSHANGEEVGNIASNVKGKYSFVFPKGGKYTYEVKVGESEDIYKFVVEVPFLDEFRPLKQKAIHTTVDGTETVRIVNLFDERVDGAEALMAEVIRRRAELDVNVESFDLEALDAQAVRNEILAEIGFSNMSMDEVSTQLEELAINEQLKLEQAEKIESNMSNQIVERSLEMKQLSEEIKTLTDKAEAETSPEKKHALLMQAKKLEAERQLMAEEIKAVSDLKDRTLSSIGKPSDGGIGKVEVIENQFNALLTDGKEEEALKLLTRNKDVINKSRSESPENVVGSLVEESVKLQEEIAVLQAKNLEMQKEKRRLEEELKVLDSKLYDAKKKEAERIKEEMAAKEQELALVKEVLNTTQASIDEKNKELYLLDTNISTLQLAMLDTPTEGPSKQVLKEALANAEEVSGDQSSQSIDAELAAIEKTHPELNPEYDGSNVAITDTTDVNTPVYESEFPSISNGHQEQTDEIRSNPALSEEEKIATLITANERTADQVKERLAVIDNLLTQEDNAALNQEKEQLVDYQNTLAQEQSSLEEERNALQAVDVAISPESLIEEIVPDYNDAIAEVQNDAKLSDKEKLTQTQRIDEDLVKELQKESSTLATQIANDPTDGEVEARKEIVDALLEAKQTEVAERSEAIAALNVDPVETNTTAEVRQALEAELAADYASDKEAIEASDKTNFEKGIAVLELEQAYLNDLTVKQSDIQRTVDRNPDDAAAQQELAVVQTMIGEQESIVDSTRNELLQQVSATEVATTVNKVDRTYSVDIGTLEQSTEPTRFVEIVEREQELQAALEAEIADEEKALERRYSVTADLNLAVLRRALNESKAREASAAAQSTDVAVTPEQKTDYIDQLREEVLGTTNNPLSENYSTKEELTEQDAQLAAYEAQLDERIDAANDELAKEPENAQLEAERDWLVEEREAVQQKRGRISISLGELETVVIADVVTAPVRKSTETDEVLKTLNTQEQELEAKLNDPGTTREERKDIEGELETIAAQKTERENVLYTENLDAGSQENASLTTQLTNYSDETNPVVKQSLELNATEQVAIEELREEADDARSEEERNYLLSEADVRQERINDDLRAVIHDQRREEIEEQKDVQLLSQEELEQRKRTFSVQIGDLTTEIVNTDQKIGEARKKELPALETRKAQLIAQRTKVQEQLRKVEDQLSKKSSREPVVTVEAMETEMTFNEERKVAGNEEYESYYNLATEALEVEQQIATLEIELKQEQDRVDELLSQPKSADNDAKIELAVENIKRIQSDIDRQSVALTQAKYTADQALPTDREEAMKMQNLVKRGVQPIKATAIAAALIQLPASGLAINENATSPYSAENPIPVGVESPSGLFYRVQIGAFAKPIPQDLFKEFNPVSGEEISGTNITRYMAGFFNSSETVVDARQKIRELGYSDAFVVAYCDGERIQFGEARRREAEGTCIAKGENELMVEVALKTAEKLGLPTTNEVQEVPENTYNQAPGAVEADPIEMKQGLFFTVQIGVFNRPVGKEFTYGMPELMTIRLPNGQIRYASGMFDSVEEALPRRRDALDAGVKGAFVTAYFEGERIPLSEARKLLAERGNGILQSEQEKVIEEPLVVEEITPKEVLRTDTVSTVNIAPENVEEVSDQRIQIITRKQFDEFPRDVLNRYNAEGNFFYDGKDGRVKSIIYKDVDDLPRLWNFRDDIDTVYLELDPAADTLEILEVQLFDSIIPGDFMDWLMRFNYRKEFIQTESGPALRIFGIEPNQVQKVQGIIRKFALEASLVEETELELELEN